jgi:hypothetical protein
MILQFIKKPSFYLQNEGFLFGCIVQKKISHKFTQIVLAPYF